MKDSSDYYDEIARGYNELHFAEQKRKAVLIQRELNLKKSDTLLDVGCGTGKVTELFDCKVTGIDPSTELLKQAKIPVVEGRAESLPFPDNSFDVVISITALHHCKDIHKALREIKRVAKRDIALSILKKAKGFKEIDSEIRKLFTIKKIVDDPTDVIFILT